MEWWTGGMQLQELLEPLEWLEREGEVGERSRGRLQQKLGLCRVRTIVESGELMRVVMCMGGELMRVVMQVGGDG